MSDPTLMAPYRNTGTVCRRRIAPWRKWLLVTTLAWLVALYSIHVTHFRHSSTDARECPKCDVDRPAVLDALPPDLAATLRFTVSYCVALSTVQEVFLSPPPVLKPHSRAPPLPTA